MPTPTYDLLSTTTLGSDTATVTFSNLSTLAAGYGDICVVVHGEGLLNANRSLFVRINQDNTANYSFMELYGQSSVGASNANFTSDPYVGYVPSGRFVMKYDLLDFATTSKYKTYLVRNSCSENWVSMVAGKWSSYNAVTRLDFTVQGGSSFYAGAVFSLYGIAS